MNNIESRKIIDTEAKIDQKITDAIDLLFIPNDDFLFNLDGKLRLNYGENPPEGAGAEVLFNKVSNLLENHHDKAEFYKTRKNSKYYLEKNNNYKTLNFRDGLYLIRIFKEEDRDEIGMKLIEGRDYNSAIICFKKDFATIHYGIEEPDHYLSKFGLDKTGDLIDLLEKKKQKEGNKPFCQIDKGILKKQDVEESFLEGARHLPWGEVFTEFFKENTIPISRNLNLERKEIVGQISNSSIPFKMVLSTNEVTDLFHGSRNGEIEIKKWVPLEIQVFAYNDELIMSFYAIEPDTFGQNYIIKLSMEKRGFFLSPKNDNSILFDKIHEFSQKISQCQTGKGKIIKNI